MCGMSRSRLIDKWEDDLPSLNAARLRARIRYARECEDGAQKKGRRLWRILREQAEAELDRRAGQPQRKSD